MRELAEARLIAGLGVEGDRYAEGCGTYSKKPHAGRQVTLIEMEVIEAISAEHHIPLRPTETRRNLTTRGLALNPLVGRRFQVGEVVLQGERLCTPCGYLDQLLGRALFGPLTGRAGLSCSILRGGVVRLGDKIAELPDLE